MKNKEHSGLNFNPFDEKNFGNMDKETKENEIAQNNLARHMGKIILEKGLKEPLFDRFVELDKKIQYVDYNIEKIENFITQGDFNQLQKQLTHLETALYGLNVHMKFASEKTKKKFFDVYQTSVNKAKDTLKKALNLSTQKNLHSFSTQIKDLQQNYLS